MDLLRVSFPCAACSPPRRWADVLTPSRMKDKSGDKHFASSSGARFRPREQNRLPISEHRSAAAPIAQEWRVAFFREAHGRRSASGGRGAPVVSKKIHIASAPSVAQKDGRSRASRELHSNHRPVLPGGRPLSKSSDRTKRLHASGAGRVGRKMMVARPCYVTVQMRRFSWQRR